MIGIGKGCHVGAQLGQDTLRSHSVNAVDRVETPELCLERAHLLLQTNVQTGNLLVKKHHLSQQPFEHEARMLGELAL
jgi:hypothetical protein